MIHVLHWRQRALTVTLFAAGIVGLFGLFYAGAKVHLLGERSPGGVAMTPSFEFEEGKVLSGLNCGSLDGAKLTEDGSVFLWGWAYDPRTGTPARAVILLDNERPLLPPIPVSRERPDVVAAKGKELLLTSGWNLRLPASWRMGREHVFHAYAVFGDGKLGPLGRRLTVGAPRNLEAASP